jgi:hypothetical protein
MDVKQFRFGDYSGQCQLHYGDAERFGTLIDPNGHAWLICADCIDSLWKDKQAFNQADKTPEVISILSDEALDAIVAQMKERGYLND